MNVHRHDYVQNKCKIKTTLLGFFHIAGNYVRIIINKVNVQNTWCNSASNANNILMLLTCQQNVYFKIPHIYFYLQLSIRWSMGRQK